jgi:peroxiredoxin 2/4
MKAPEIGAPAPEFVAESSHGRIRLADYRGRYLVLFSYPSDFEPVCTTELLAFAKARSAFDEAGCSLLGLSASDHEEWLRYIEEHLGYTVDFPLIDDSDGAIAAMYGMLHPAVSCRSTVRSVFVIDPGGMLRATMHYPPEAGRSVNEILRLVHALRIADAFGVILPEGWQPGREVITFLDGASRKAAHPTIDETFNENWII